ncbi:pilus protein PilZ [Novosphingobium barchaimii LL02]|uniref:Pilus protein PilZ n=1 Tax=Novosphingobium barchaimii LL02 TaxID=1114963 RepID=A0A0J7Y6C8_9SPHN|nr:PilZ domain-containing protein [Novosphingobium barchaimii]KMS59479.1 pilus protein PilZ [Novosphingobium barchaimii LL02]
MQGNDNGDRLNTRRTVLLQGRCRKSPWHVFPVELGDLSQGGCSIVGSSESFARGEHVQLRVAHLRPIEAEVRWLLPGKVGVEFRAPLNGNLIEELGELYGIAAGPSSHASG